MYSETVLASSIYNYTFSKVQLFKGAKLPGSEPLRFKSPRLQMPEAHIGFDYATHFTCHVWRAIFNFPPRF